MGRRPLSMSVLLNPRNRGAPGIDDRRAARPQLVLESSDRGRRGPLREVEPIGSAGEVQSWATARKQRTWGQFDTVETGQLIALVLHAAMLLRGIHNSDW
jgi:hypothetical protein